MDPLFSLYTAVLCSSAVVMDPFLVRLEHLGVGFMLASLTLIIFSHGTCALPASSLPLVSLVAGVLGPFGFVFRSLVSQF
jgi:hypothetical protein